MSQKDAYEKKIQAKLDEVSAEIERLQAKAREAEADAEIAYNKQIDELRKKHEELKNKLDEVMHAGEDAWKDIKAGAELAYESLSDALKSATSRFK